MGRSRTEMQTPLTVEDYPSERRIETLEEALDFIKGHHGGERSADRSGTIHMLQSATSAEAISEAESAFRAWAEATNVLIAAGDQKIGFRRSGR